MSESSTPWDEVLDRLSIQVDRQEAALRQGHAPPADLEIDPPDTPLTGADRQRAIVLFERCETLLDLATERVVAGRRRPTISPYRGAR
ncbi:MAG: hypothetical protein AAF480_02425 [Actinomycetota bacterium]